MEMQSLKHFPCMYLSDIYYYGTKWSMIDLRKKKIKKHGKLFFFVFYNHVKLLYKNDDMWETNLISVWKIYTKKTVP
jgi:hypothetical protein